MMFDLNGCHIDSQYRIIDDSITTSDIKVTTKLPTAEEYREAAEKFAFKGIAQWSEPKYQCPKCDGGMCRNEMEVFTSYPPKYQYKCDKCGHIEYQYI